MQDMKFYNKIVDKLENERIEVISFDGHNVNARYGEIDISISFEMCICHGGRLSISSPHCSFYYRIEHEAYDKDKGIVDEESELLLQKKEAIDGGDIRIHVLTTRTGQKILASMKRIKLGNDFRSNVSLGATVEPVEITKEQEEIALKVAKISGMPWCAVDVAPLVKGSNKEIGDNIVLEYNASPGTQGVSEAIKENFMSILLDSINDATELVLTTKAIGYKENVYIKFDENSRYVELEAKLDTGNGSSASTIGVDKLEEDGDKVIATLNSKKYIFNRHGKSTASVGPITEERITVILPELKIGTRKIKNVEFALVDNRKKSTKVLINRDVLSKLGYVINPAEKHTLDKNNI